MKTIKEILIEFREIANKRLLDVYNNVDAAKSTIELYSICEIEKIRLYNELLKRDEVELLTYLDDVLKEDYFYWYVNPNKVLKSKICAIANYVHKESESYRLSEALKLLRIVEMQQDRKVAENLKLSL